MPIQVCCTQIYGFISGCRVPYPEVSSRFRFRCASCSVTTYTQMARSEHVTWRMSRSLFPKTGPFGVMQGRPRLFLDQMSCFEIEKSWRYSRNHWAKAPIVVIHGRCDQIRSVDSAACRRCIFVCDFKKKPSWPA